MCVEGLLLTGSVSPLMTELFAIKQGIIRAISMGWNNIILETDALAAVKAIDRQAPIWIAFPLCSGIEAPII